MKLIVNNDAFIDAKGNKLMEVVKECSVDAALAGIQCDGIVLNLTDLARLRVMTPEQLSRWLAFMQTKMRISFDPGVVK